GNQKGLTPANGISPNFIHIIKVLSDSNNKESIRRSPRLLPEHRARKEKILGQREKIDNKNGI
ncbi:hypothetical protein, partial [uncultured Parabacteroides sp.]|uniref:hypothetical protein n=1 Tax=uncultured Parabacteroides sp. TaxID=512312 RepID=UPI002804771C